MKNKEIAILVRNVKKHKENAFEELYKATVKTVYFYCYKSLGNKQDANDAMQTVFLQLYNTITTLREPKAFNQFLYKIMAHTCTKFYKLKSRDDMDELEVCESMPEENKEFLPAEALEKEDVREKIAEMIETLPLKQREAIIFFYYEGMSIKEIAEITDSKFDAVNNRLVKARKSLRERAKALIEEGALNYTMAIVPIPILTRILLEEAERIVTPEVCELAWQGICASLGIAVVGTAGAATTTTVTTTTTTVATSSVLTNVAIGVTCAAILTGTVYLGFHVNNTFINPPAIVEGYNEFDIVALIPEIVNRVEFADFVSTYGFMFLGGEWLSEKGNHVLYILDEPDRYVYLGYIENLQNEFRVVYQATEERLPLTDDQIAEWFAGR